MSERDHTRAAGSKRLRSRRARRAQHEECLPEVLQIDRAVAAAMAASRRLGRDLGLQTAGSTVILIRAHRREAAALRRAGLHHHAAALDAAVDAWLTENPIERRGRKVKARRQQGAVPGTGKNAARQKRYRLRKAEGMVSVTLTLPKQIIAELLVETATDKAETTLSPILINYLRGFRYA